MNAPLEGIRIVEFEGIGPGPLAGLMLAQMGAQVTVVARAQSPSLVQRMGGKASSANPLRQGKSVVELNLKQPADVEQALALVAQSDGLIEGNRPGVMEKLGLGPAHCAQRNPRLVYGRMTGWGQNGPLAHTAGHDLNYVALTGLLSLCARPGQTPMVAPTMMGDAPGALGLCFGMVCALLQARSTGRGCVVDAAIVDVVAMLGTLVQWVRASGQIDNERPSMFHDSPFYDVYACADGRYISLGPLEPQFYALFLQKLGLTDVDLSQQYQTSTWPALKQRIAQVMASQPRAHWCEVFEGSDACVAPVLSLAEAAQHPHHIARGTYRQREDGSIEVAAAPRFMPLV